MLLAGALLLSACQPPSSNIDSINQVDLSAKTPRKVTTRNDGPVLKPQVQPPRYQVFTGSTTTPTEDGAEPPPGVGSGDDGSFTINLDAATVADAAKLILGETLGYNYTIDPNVQATLTIVSNRPMSARQLLDAFEAALRIANMSIVRNGDSYKVVQTQQVLDGDVGPIDMNGKVSDGYGISAVPLRFVNPASMMEILEGFAAQSGSTRASKAGNMILIRGTAAQRRSLVDVVLNFDVDWMKDQTSGIAAIANGRAEDIAAKVERIFAADTVNAGPNALKIIPVPSINSLIVIASAPDKVNRALTWIKRLDRESLDAPKSYIYAVQNGNATELARILNATYGGGGGDAGTTAEVAPDNQQMDVSVDGGGGGQPGMQGTPAGDNGMQTPPEQPPPTAEPPAATNTTASSTAAPGSSASSARITPIPANNTILIRATPKDYREILATLQEIDAPPTQVMINTMIAEVSLNDTLNYGVQAYFQNSNFGFLFQGNEPASGQTGISIAPKVPGMNFILGGIKDPKLVIDALAKVTKVRIVSSPTIVVLENETASINVGDSIPVQSSQQTTSGGQTVNSYEYKETGVILKVKPRVAANGMVTIDLGQELSAVQEKIGVGGNPRFTKRTIKSKVSVNDQQTVLLGGLISGQESRNRATLPGAGKLPIIGKFMGTNGNDASRTELIVFMTPTIVRNGQEAADSSQAMRDRMKNLNFD